MAFKKLRDFERAPHAHRLAIRGLTRKPIENQVGLRVPAPDVDSEPVRAIRALARHAFHANPRGVAPRLGGGLRDDRARLLQLRPRRYLNRLLRRYAEDALPKPSARRAGMRAEIERVLPELLPHGKAGIADVARRLNTSTRTLSRKLHEEGTGFADIRDALRAS